MKTVKLVIENRFPKFHKREGENTNFEEKILDGRKKHSVQSNFSKWNGKFHKIKEGSAKLSVETWTGIPYNSERFVILEMEDAVIQSLEFKKGKYLVDGTTEISLEELATNDGLKLDDFRDWFKVFPADKMAIIQFDKNFKY